MSWGHSRQRRPMVERTVALTPLLQDYLRVHYFLTLGLRDKPFYWSGQEGTISFEGQGEGGHTYAAFWSSTP